MVSKRTECNTFEKGSMNTFCSQDSQQSKSSPRCCRRSFPTPAGLTPNHLFFGSHACENVLQDARTSTQAKDRANDHRDFSVDVSPVRCRPSLLPFSSENVS